MYQWALFLAKHEVRNAAQVSEIADAFAQASVASPNGPRLAHQRTDEVDARTAEYLSRAAPPLGSAEQLFQGPIADALSTPDNSRSCGLLRVMPCAERAMRRRTCVWGMLEWNSQRAKWSLTSV